MANKPTPAELERGYSLCDCGAVHLHQAGYEAKLHCCSLCKQWICDADEFFNADAVEILSK